MDFMKWVFLIDFMKWVFTKRGDLNFELDDLVKTRGEIFVVGVRVGIMFAVGFIKI